MEVAVALTRERSREATHSEAPQRDRLGRRWRHRGRRPVEHPGQRVRGAGLLHERHGSVTAMTLRIGYKASAEQFGPRELVELGVLAEQAGMDSAWVSDHFQPWREHGGHAPFAVAWLAAVAERTDRLVLGTSVLTPTFRYNPAVIAQAFATLGCLAPGRIVLGVGTGEALNEHAAGMAGDWPEFAERFARLRESVRLIRALFSGERVDLDGDYYAVHSARLHDIPEGPRVPVYVAAGGPVVARYAGRVGDGMICTSGKGMGLYTDALLPALAEGAAKADRDPGQVETMIEIKLSYDPDPAAALENTRFWAPLSLTAEQKHSITSTAQMEAEADALPIEQVARRWIVASTPEEVVQAVQPYVTAGFTHLVLHAPGHDQRRFLELYAGDLDAALRGLTR